jgi:hypothetical protein
MTTTELSHKIIEEYKNKSFLTEEDIYWTLMNLGQKQPMYLKVITELETNFNYIKVIYNTDLVDEFGDGHTYTPIKNQECNENEEWAWIPQPIKINIKGLKD